MRSNGGLIGPKKVANTSVASGLWSVQDVQREVGAGNWVTIGDFESIATTTVGGTAQSTITFSSIPSVFKHLQLRVLARSNRAGVDDIFVVRFNSDSGANYSRHFLLGDGSATNSFGQGGETYILADGCAGGNATSNIFGSCVMDVLDYADTNKFKTLRGLGGLDRNGAGYLTLVSGNWRNTNAVTSVTITSFYSSSFVQYSSFALYGIKG